jgi:hypothetical protein
MSGRHNRRRKTLERKKNYREKESHSKETRKTEEEIMIFQTVRQKKERWKDTRKMNRKKR